MTNNGKFTVKFRGIRGSYPSPNKGFLEIGGNTSCVEVNVGGHLIILDAGTGIISLGNELMKKHIASSDDMFHRTPINATILLSHIHADHIQGLNFFKPLGILTSKIRVFGSSDYSESLEENLHTLLYGKSFPVSLNDVTADFVISNITDSEVLIFPENSPVPLRKRVISTDDMTPVGNEVIVNCMKSYAHGTEGVMVYKISYKNKTLVYATDKESYIGGDKRLAFFARNANLLIHDSQYTGEDYMSPIAPKQGFGHSTFEMAIETAKMSQVEKLAFFHFDPSYDDEKLKNIETYYKSQFEGCFMAYEGYETELL
ncbi:MAG: MBL fold metallo-hydrolase [Candidatus Gastranaerophilaceae bacterium]